MLIPSSSRMEEGINEVIFMIQKNKIKNSYTKLPKKKLKKSKLNLYFFTNLRFKHVCALK